MVDEDTRLMDEDQFTGGGGYSQPTLPDSGSTQPVGPRVQAPTGLRISPADVGPAVGDPVMTGGSTLTFNPTSDDVGDGGVDPADTSSSGSAPTGGAILHGPGEIWSLAPNHGCAPGYAQQQTADGRWTCIPMSDFRKIFAGDFSPLFPGAAPAGVRPVDPESSVTFGGQQMTAQQAADMNAGVTDVVPAAPSGTGGSNTQGTSGGTNTTGGTSKVDRLIDLVSAMYAGAGVKGGGSGFDGLVSGPLATAVESTGGEGAPVAAASKTSPALVLVLVLIAGGVAWWYYKRKKGKAA